MLRDLFSRRAAVLLLDVLALAGVTLTLAVIVFGGVRVNYYGLRFSAISITRLLVVTGVLLGVRYALFRQDPLHRRVWQRMEAFRRSRAVRAVFPIFVASRVGVMTVGLGSMLLIGFGEEAPFRVSRNEVVNLPARWDAGWYLGIAGSGYETRPNLGRQQRIAFFPAYPVLMRAAGDFLGAGVTRSYVHGSPYMDTREGRLLWGGVAVSLGAFFLALLYVYRLARDDFGSRVARGSVVLLAAYPFAVFFSAPYTESLFLLGTVATFHHLRRGELTGAAGWGLLVGLTKPNGFLLSVPLFLLWLPTAASLVRRSLREGSAHAASAGRVVAGLLAVAMPTVGMLLFSAYLYGLTGQPLAWLAVQQRGWNRGFGNLGSLLLERYELVAAQGFHAYAFSNPDELVNGLAALLALALVWPIARRLGIAHAALVAVIVIPPLLAGGFVSLGRFTSVLFPVFIYLALALPRMGVLSLAFFSAQLQALVAVTFYTWRPPF